MRKNSSNALLLSIFCAFVYRRSVIIESRHVWLLIVSLDVNVSWIGSLGLPFLAETDGLRRPGKHRIANLIVNVLPNCYNMLKSSYKD